MEELRNKLQLLEKSLTQIPREIGVVPNAVLVISGHWEEDEFTVMASPHPPMLYDYSGFPEHTYHVKYGAPGSPQLAQHVRTLIEAAGMPVDPRRFRIIVRNLPGLQRIGEAPSGERGGRGDFLYEIAELQLLHRTWQNYVEYASKYREAFGRGF